MTKLKYPSVRSHFTHKFFSEHSTYFRTVTTIKKVQQYDSKHNVNVVALKQLLNEGNYSSAISRSGNLVGPSSIIIAKVACFLAIGKL